LLRGYDAKIFHDPQGHDVGVHNVGSHRLVLGSSVRDHSSVQSLPQKQIRQGRTTGHGAEFAEVQGATFSDVGPIRERELMSGGGRGVLSETGGPLVLLVVKKEGDFSFSVTNLGLREKFSLGIEVSAERVEESALAGFFSELSLEWTVQRVDGGIMDEPPCDRSPKLS
jgi:hypothetical protein